MAIDDDRLKLLIAGLPDSFSEGILRRLFETAGGTVVDVSVPRDRVTGRTRGFGFVTLSTEDEVRSARELLDGSMQSGRSISVRPFQRGPARRLLAGRGEGALAQASESTEDRTLYLGNLPHDANASEVEQMLRRAGVSSVVRVNLPLDPQGRPRGFAFVTVGSPGAARDAIDRLQDHELNGRSISASIAGTRDGRERVRRVGYQSRSPEPSDDQPIDEDLPDQRDSGAPVELHQWKHYSFQAMPDRSAIVVVRQGTAHTADIEHLVMAICHYFMTTEKEDERPDDDDILVEGAVLADGWHMSFTLTAQVFRRSRRPIGTILCDSALFGGELQSVSLELPEFQLFATITPSNELPFCSVTLTPAAYRRTEEPINDWLCPDDISGFSTQMQRALSVARMNDADEGRW